MSSEQYHVFVYGTLQPGQVNYQRCAEYVVHSVAATISAKLFNLSCGYPAITHGSDKVSGWVLTFTDISALSNLDQLEGFDASGRSGDNLYDRQVVTASTKSGEALQAYVYVMTPEKVESIGGQHIPAGIWTSLLFPSTYTGE